MSELIGPAELKAALAGQHRPVVLDIRWQLGGPSTRDEYLEGHIPGARWVDLDVDLCTPPGPGGRHPLPDPGALAATLARLGVSDGEPVILYDAQDSTAAARGWWVLRWAGVAHVRVVDGGFAAWTAAGFDIESGPPEYPPTSRPVVIRAGSMRQIGAREAEELATQGRLVDARAHARFLGQVEPIDAVAGHIPGARNVPTASNVDDSGRFLDPQTLRASYEAAVGDLAAGVGVYCGSGVTAAHSVLALTLAGVDAALYPGSWSEWITNPGRAVATGDEA